MFIVVNQFVPRGSASVYQEMRTWIARVVSFVVEGSLGAIVCFSNGGETQKNETPYTEANKVPRVSYVPIVWNPGANYSWRREAMEDYWYVILI